MSGSAKQPSSDSLLVDSGDVEATLAATASTLRATYLHPYQMHGSLGTSCAVADVQGRQGDVVVGDAVGVSDAQHDGVAARPRTRATSA